MERSFRCWWKRFRESWSSRKTGVADLLAHQSLTGAVEDFGCFRRQIIRFFGYPSETHTIVTPDGYFLELHRIPRGRNGQSNPNLPPVLIQHGLLESSGSFLIIGPDDALPCLLADLGFDVWLGNSRGNKYSRGHVTLDPDEFEFWNYTYHEGALNDITTEIDFILEQTNREKLIYVGHSMGTTMFFILMSMIPEYNEKIELGVMMAPVAYLYHCGSPLIQAIAPLAHLVKEAMAARLGEVLPDSELFEFVAGSFCAASIFSRDVCGSIVHLLTGDDPRSYTPEFLQVILHHFPEGYSFKTLLHYGQFVAKERFGMLDYLEDGNMAEYGVPYPPDYELEKITAPISLYAAKMDYLADLTDVKRLPKYLKSLKRLFVVEYCKFGHLDFLFSEYVKEEVNDYIIADIMQHLGQNITGES
ncbi:hypothetical protein RUM44_008098 [Polyplax serrata]|uniref:Lipase n=1 Tax=Polyplax serrata TaxID=468196 RepID=A0ABR1BBD3_POLSC